MVVSDIVYFTVQQSEDQNSFQLSQITPIALAIVIVIVAVVLVSLVYFKRRKKLESNSRKFNQASRKLANLRKRSLTQSIKQTYSQLNIR